MYTRISKEDAKGKTVLSIYHEEYNRIFAIIFDDLTYISIRAMRGWGGDIEIDFEDLDDYEKMQADMISPEDYKEIEDKRKAECIAREKERKKEEYLRLKKEFENE